MYRNCIFCTADLGRNESIELFPVGRALEFDGEKGRLWAICLKCARWNLAPLEERWEAIEAGERLFHDTRLRAQSENVGLARLRDGTRLIRIGAALPSELAAWRYGEQLERRRRRAALYGTVLAVAGVGVAVAGVALAPVGFGGGWGLYQLCRNLKGFSDGHRTVGWVDAEAVVAGAGRMRVRRTDAAESWLSVPDDGQGLALNLPLSVVVPDPKRPGRLRKVPLMLRGRQARHMMTRAMVHVNSGGASTVDLERAMQAIRAAGSPDEFVKRVARRRLLLTGADPRPGLRQSERWADGEIQDDSIRPAPAVALALEMALQEETERRAMEGELELLEAMWREAEEIAAIADGLPGPPVPQTGRN
jgi:hypothetical protein